MCRLISSSGEQQPLLNGSQQESYDTGKHHMYGGALHLGSFLPVIYELKKFFLNHPAKKAAEVTSKLSKEVLKCSTKACLESTKRSENHTFQINKDNMYLVAIGACTVVAGASLMLGYTKIQNGEIGSLPLRVTVGAANGISTAVASYFVHQGYKIGIPAIVTGIFGFGLAFHPKKISPLVTKIERKIVQCFRGIFGRG